jgi:hypothetical protein
VFVAASMLSTSKVHAELDHDHLETVIMIAWNR